MIEGSGRPHLRTTAVAVTITTQLLALLAGCMAGNAWSPLTLDAWAVPLAEIG